MQASCSRNHGPVLQMCGRAGSEDDCGTGEAICPGFCAFCALDGQRGSLLQPLDISATEVGMSTRFELCFSRTPFDAGSDQQWRDT